jgi:hypothetical protein
MAPPCDYNFIAASAGAFMRVWKCCPLAATVGFVLIAGCSPRYPGGAVKDPAYAASLAKHKCGHSGEDFFVPWSATLTGDIWKVTVGTPGHGGFSVDINARTGGAGRCRAAAT